MVSGIFNNLMIAGRRYSDIQFHIIVAIIDEKHEIHDIHFETVQLFRRYCKRIKLNHMFNHYQYKFHAVRKNIMQLMLLGIIIVKKEKLYRNKYCKRYYIDPDFYDEVINKEWFKKCGDYDACLE